MGTAQKSSPPCQLLGLHPANIYMEDAITEATGINKATPLSTGVEVLQQTTFIPGGLHWLHGCLNQR